MFIITSEREIPSNPLSVYDVITDLAAYGEWNPFNTVDVDGPVKVGDKLTVHSQIDGQEMTVQHGILEMIPGRKFKWNDLGFFTYFAYGERTRFLLKTERGTHYRCELKITGILSPLVKKQFSKKLQPAMDAETRAIDLRVAELYGQDKQ